MILNQFYDRDNVLITQLKCDNCPKQIIIRLTISEIRSGRIAFDNLPKECNITDKGIVCEDYHDKRL